MKADTPTGATLTEVTRRAIMRYLTDSVRWWGVLPQADFLGRIYRLDDPTAQSIWQHTENNCDWEDDWVFHDPMFSLLDAPDDVFLRFVCETIHPAVRIDEAQIDAMVGEYNTLLERDGWTVSTAVEEWFIRAFREAVYPTGG
jgi:hypothetical protein